MFFFCWCKILVCDLAVHAVVARSEPFQSNCQIQCIFHNAEQYMALLTEQQHVKHTNMFISVVLDGNCKEMVVQLVSKLRINVFIYNKSKHFN